MAFRIASSLKSLTPPAPVKSKGYLAWLHTLPCVVSGRTPVEAAHVSYADTNVGAFGRGKSQKVSDRWAVPLHPDLHVDQHRTNEASWWAMQGVDPHQIALILWGIWNEHKRDEATATEVATEVIKKRRATQ
jgi:hypothetical protein